MPITPTRATKAEDIVKADRERVEHARRVALCNSGPYPETEHEFILWCERAEHLFQEALSRVN